MDPITITASRGSAFSLPEMEMLVGSVIVVAVLAWMIMAHLRRDRQQPHA
ncbi:MAG: hypothetical protein JSR67_01080 [Proteobacteria bacterium]|nr:hypothetical protein [Pseudomonadota bacterium]